MIDEQDEQVPLRNDVQVANEDAQSEEQRLQDELFMREALELAGRIPVFHRHGACIFQNQNAVKQPAKPARPLGRFWERGYFS